MTYGLITLEEQAIRGTIKILLKRIKQEYDLDNVPLFNIEYLNNKRYAIINITELKISYAIIFRTQRFHAFGTIFKEYGESGEGETLNFKEWNERIQFCEAIIYCYQNLHSLEYRIIYINQLKNMLKLYKAYIYNNKSDGKEEIIFSCRYLQELYVC